MTECPEEIIIGSSTTFCILTAGHEGKCQWHPIENDEDNCYICSKKIKDHTEEQAKRCKDFLAAQNRAVKSHTKELSENE